MRSLVFVILGLFFSPALLVAQDPLLHSQIDQLIAAKAGQAPQRCDDAEFVRRVYLDFAGRIPTPTEARQFLDDSSADKRSPLIDQLLAGPDYPRRMEEAFQVMLMERLGEHPEWSKFLRESFTANKPWDQLVREILSPNPDDEATRGSAFFLSKRLENYGQNPVDLPALTRDVGRMFLGFDLQCAQCHDHLFIDDYKQADFQGLFTFLGHTALRSDVKFPAVTEKLVDKKTEFMSVFRKEPLATGPRLPGGTEFEIPTFAKGEEFATPPDKKTRAPGVPKFSPLKLLAESLPRPENTQFAKNAANRLWWLLLGRGLVHPLDLHHSDNPPSHPELLDLLAKELVAHQFDIQWLLKEIALSETYQATSRVSSSEAVKPELFLVALEKPLSAEQLMRSMLQATGELERLRKPDQPEVAIPDDVKARFAKAFANPPREPEVEFAPSVKAALFLMNDSVVLGWLKPQSGNLVERASQMAEPEKIADEIYLSVLSRLPTDEERADVAAHLAANADKKTEAVGQLVWALMASTEFAVNH